MIVDTSVLVAIITREPGSESLIKTIVADGDVKMSAASLAELNIVMRAKGIPAQIKRISLILEELGIAIVPFDQEQAMVAGDAWSRFGKLSGSRAKLNFGDCMTYALAATTGEPLLFVGDDFSWTDLKLVRVSPPYNSSP